MWLRAYESPWTETNESVFVNMAFVDSIRIRESNSRFYVGLRYPNLTSYLPTAYFSVADAEAFIESELLDNVR